MKLSLPKPLLQNFCKMYDKKFIDPKPYRAHLVSCAHKEELELRAEEEDRIIIKLIVIQLITIIINYKW